MTHYTNRAVDTLIKQWQNIIAPLPLFYWPEKARSLPSSSCEGEKPVSVTGNAMMYPCETNASHKFGKHPNSSESMSNTSTGNASVVCCVNEMIFTISIRRIIQLCLNTPAPHSVRKINSGMTNRKWLCRNRWWYIGSKQKWTWRMFSSLWSFEFGLIILVKLIILQIIFFSLTTNLWLQVNFYISSFSI